MSGLMEGMEYLVEESKPDYIELDGKTFSNKKMYQIEKKEPMADILRTKTLTSMIDYIKSNTDKMCSKMLIHVESPTRVSLLSKLNAVRDREILMIVDADLPQIPFEQYLSSEDFVIKLMSRFVDDDSTDKQRILKFSGTAQSGTIKKYGDDGVSQSATIQKTTTSKEEDIVPNPVILRPYRTFHEVEQPVSPFIFRVKDFGDDIGAALFEADGGDWKRHAMYSIKQYLIEMLDGMELENIKFTVIA